MMSKRDQEKGVTERAITVSSSRVVLSLSEVAALSACSVEDVLLKGARGELRLCARVPEDAVVYSTNVGLVELADPVLTGLERKLYEGRAIDMSALAAGDIQLVVLSKADCAAAVAQGEVNQSLFATGVRVEATGIPLVVEPLAPEKSVGMLDCPPFRIFACYPRAVDPNNWVARQAWPPLQLKITPDAIKILRTDLISSEPVSNRPIRFDIGFSDEPHLPKTLVKLYQVAIQHWDCSRPGWEKPNDESVERSLRELEEFKKKLAGAGATLLRRSFGNWDQDYYELRRAEGKPTEFDSLVVVASAWKTTAGSKEDFHNAAAIYRDKAKAFAYWDSLGIKGYLAQYAWQIASPKHARSTGRPRGT